MRATRSRSVARVGSNRHSAALFLTIGIGSVNAGSVPTDNSAVLSSSFTILCSLSQPARNACASSRPRSSVGMKRFQSLPSTVCMALVSSACMALTSAAAAASGVG